MKLSPRDARIVLEAKRRGISLRTKQERWCPHDPTPKQAEFLRCEALEALYGGAAGGGKSDALLMAALQHADRPDYAALILRKSYADLALPGAIMDRSHTWLAGSRAHWDGTEKTWTFPGGARLSFGYLQTEKDKYRYQSSEFQFIGFDELTQFPETQYRYMFSRLRRRTASAIPLRMRGATNPGGIGHDWVHARFIKEPGGRAFVPATLSDNPHVDAEEYRRSLAELDKTTRDQLERGVWVRDKGGLIYRFTDANLVPDAPRPADWRRVLAIDYGSSQREPTTAFALWGFSPELPAAYLLETSKHAGLTPSSIATHVRAIETAHGKLARVVGDQGGLGGGYNEEMRQRERIPIQNVEKKDKLGFRKLFRGALEDGRILIVDKGGCNDAWIEEANQLSWNEQGTDALEGQPDHATDAGLYGWRECRAFLHKPKEQLPAAGSKEYYDRQAAEHRERAMKRIENKQRGELDILGGR